MGVREQRVQFDGFAKGGDGGLLVAEVRLEEAEVVADLGVLRGEGDGLLHGGKRLLRASERALGHGETGVQDGRTRLFGDGGAVGGDRFCGASGTLKGVAKFHVELGLFRLAAGDFGLELGNAFLQIAAVGDLGDGGVQIVLGAVGYDLAAVIVRGAVLFRNGCERIWRRLALDEMVRHDRVYDVFTAALGHMAADAVAGLRVRLGLDGSWGVASGAGLVVGIFRGLAVLDVVRVVAGGAAEFAGTGDVALGFLQTVDGVDDFELVVVAGAWGVVER